MAGSAPSAKETVTPTDPGPPWRLYVPLAAAWLLLGLVLTTTSWAPPVWTRRFILIGYVVIPALGCAAALQRARRREGRQRAAWFLFAVGFVSWSFGGAVWLYYNVRFDHDPPFPSIADPALLAFSVCAAAALALLSSRWGPPLRAPELLDILFIGLANGLAVFTFVFKPYLKAASADLLTDVTYLAFPTVDAVTLSVALFALIRAPRGLQPKAILLASGLALFAGLNIVWLFLTARGLYRTGSPLDLGWHLAFFIIIAGALYNVRTTATRASPGLTARHFAVPLLLSLFVFTVLVYDVVLGDGLGAFDAVLLGLLILLLVVRQSVALAQNERLRVTVQNANRRLEEAAAFKARFISATAHELANPLTPLQIHARLLVDRTRAPGQEKQHASANVLLRNIDRLLRLVQDLLALARLEAGRYDVRVLEVDLAALVQEGVEFQRPLAAEQRVELVFQPSGPVPVQTDPQRVTQILSNLLSNAIKYSNPDARVTVALRAADGRAVLTVADKGAGLEPAQIDRMFAPFAQVQGEGTQKQGTGLGLYICKTLAERLGGRLFVISQGQDRGATFTLELPTRIQDDAQGNGRPLPGGIKANS